MANDRELFWLCKRRRKETLVRWWHELNRWKWPAGILQPPEPRDDRPRRGAFMLAIEKELGQRVILGKL